MHIFWDDKSEDRIKRGSKLFFHFLYILETKENTEGILDISNYHSINQKILSTPHFRHVFRYRIWCKSGYEWYINNPLCKSLQNIVLNKTGKFGACECNWSGDSLHQVWGSPILRKWPLKICIVKSPKIRIEAISLRQNCPIEYFATTYHAIYHWKGLGLQLTVVWSKYVYFLCTSNQSWK